MKARRTPAISGAPSSPVQRAPAVQSPGWGNAARIEDLKGTCEEAGSVTWGESCIDPGVLCEQQGGIAVGDRCLDPAVVCEAGGGEWTAEACRSDVEPPTPKDMFPRETGPEISTQTPLDDLTSYVPSKRELERRAMYPHELVEQDGAVAKTLGGGLTWTVHGLLGSEADYHTTAARAAVGSSAVGLLMNASKGLHSEIRAPAPLGAQEQALPNRTGSIRR